MNKICVPMWRVSPHLHQ